jgi:hypothetical protein
MGIKKFEDFEHSLEEDDQKALASDHINAKKDLLRGSTDKIRGPLYFADNEDGTMSVWAVGENEKDQLEHPVVIKVIGYDSRFSFKGIGKESESK